MHPILTAIVFVDLDGWCFWDLNTNFLLTGFNKTNLLDYTIIGLVIMKHPFCRQYCFIFGMILL